MINNLMRPAGSRAAMAGGPILLLVPAPARSFDTVTVAPKENPDPSVLGVGLIRRTVKVAHRAGYSQTFILTQEDRARFGVVATIPKWSGVDVAFAPSQTAPLVIAPAAILAETDWLERLAKTQIESAAWAAAPQGIVMLAAEAARDALAALDADGGAYDLAAVQVRLNRRFGAPAGIPVGIDPMVVVTPTDARVAERRLLRALVKDTDGFMARHVERPISLQISRLLAPTEITPNQMSLISIVVGLCAGPLFLSPLPSWQTVGALLFLAHSILDGCDGELARLKFQESRLGGVLDFWGDNVVHSVIFACMAVGWSRSVDAAWPLLLGAAAVLGALGSASFVYWRLMRVKRDRGPLFTSVSTIPDRRLARLLDAASRRDFIYLVLALALIGKSNWFLLLAAFGAPIYLFLVIFLAARERVLKTIHA